MTVESGQKGSYEFDAREVQCARTVNDGKDRCPWRGPLDGFAEHTDATGHAACAVCELPLADDETGTCHRCIAKAALDLAEIEDTYATLPNVVERSGYRMRGLPGGDALVMLADGSMESPQRPNQYTQPVDVGPTVYVEHRRIVGDHVVHEAFIEDRVPSDGREHVADHWDTDPPAVLAVLEANERGWRHVLGHGPAEDVATVTSCVRYLRTWLNTAARQHPAFGDFAREIRQLRSRLQHVSGLADDPKDAPAECFDCGGRLQRAYRPLRADLYERIAAARAAVAEDERRIVKHLNAETQKHPDQPELRKRPRVPARATRVRHAVTGAESEGLADSLTCSRCRRVYDPGEYGLLLQTRANSISGWVTVRVAAETLRRPEQTIWRWVRELAVPSVCSTSTHRVLVAWDDAKTRAEVAQRRQHERAQEAS